MTKSSKNTASRGSMMRRGAEDKSEIWKSVRAKMSAISFGGDPLPCDGLAHAQGFWTPQMEIHQARPGAEGGARRASHAKPATGCVGRTGISRDQSHELIFASAHLEPQFTLRSSLRRASNIRSVYVETTRRRRSTRRPRRQHSNYFQKHPTST